MKIKEGFIPALGTPLDHNGNFMAESFKKQIKMLLDAGAAGMLAMGSMGQQAFIPTEECKKIAKTAVETVAGRVPVFVGAMDNSIARTKERMAAMEDLDLNAFVFTTPYYEIDSKEQVIKYFKSVAAATKHSIMLYDLPSVTNFKITYDMVLRMQKEIPNLIGIKSADLQMLRKLKLNKEIPADFLTFFSGLDVFDIAYKWGITNNLDGMIDCTPNNFRKAYKAMDEGDFATAAECMSNVVELRDFFLERDLWPAFSAAMNLLGCEGSFAPDWATDVSSETLEEIKAEMKKIGEL